MIDLHCHLLPGLDDGASDLQVALDMARIAVSDGIETIACTPHIMPGVYNNTAGEIRLAVKALSDALLGAGVPLRLVVGADIHVAPDLVQDLIKGAAPTLGGSRYFLLEPPHHVVPPRLFDLAFNALTSGFVPVLTHPERLSWIEHQYPLIGRMFRAGVLMQVTGGSFLGRFGPRAQYWAERMLEEGMVDVMASDGHDSRRRRPRLAEARDRVANRTNDLTASRIVATVPQRILMNVLPSQLRQP